MLKRLRVQGFKSLADIEVEFPALTFLFWPNASGKSNLLDALLILSCLATERTLADALSGPVRGYPADFFQFPTGGLASLLEKDRPEFSLEADLQTKGRDRMKRKRVSTINNRGVRLYSPHRAGAVKNNDLIRNLNSRGRDRKIFMPLSLRPKLGGKADPINPGQSFSW